MDATTAIPAVFQTDALNIIWYHLNRMREEGECTDVSFARSKVDGSVWVEYIH